MSKKTTFGKTPRPMTSEAIERAAHADRDARPLTAVDLKRMKRTPQLAFEYDPTVERGVRMTQLIDELAPEDADDD